MRYSRNKRLPRRKNYVSFEITDITDDPDAYVCDWGVIEKRSPDHQPCGNRVVMLYEHSLEALADTDYFYLCQKHVDKYESTKDDG